MNARIEHTHDPLTLLRELPDGWAQTCIARPPRNSPPGRTLAILAETQRVLREDGTLWLLLNRPTEQQRQGLLLTDLQASGFREQAIPPSARWLAARLPGRLPVVLYLFSKQPDHLYDERAGDLAQQQRRLARCCQPPACGRARQLQRCALVLERERLLRLVAYCVRAGSSPLACGQCGAPYRRDRSAMSARSMRRPTCRHDDRGGRCLVLDPFYEPAGLPTLQAALYAGRNFLGIEDLSRGTEDR